MSLAREAEIVARTALVDEWNTLNHTAAVVKLLGPDASEQERAAAWLHDVLEDTRVTTDDLIDIGFPDEVIIAVELLTRAEDETYHEYKQRLLGTLGPAGAIARKVKLADARHNLSRCKQAAGVPKWARLAKDRYEPLIAQLAPIITEEAAAA